MNPHHAIAMIVGSFFSFIGLLGAGSLIGGWYLKTQAACYSVAVVSLITGMSVLVYCIWIGIL